MPKHGTVFIIANRHRKRRTKKTEIRGLKEKNRRLLALGGRMREKANQTHRPNLFLSKKLGTSYGRMCRQKIKKLLRSPIKGKTPLKKVDVKMAMNRRGYRKTRRVYLLMKPGRRGAVA